MKPELSDGANVGAIIYGRPSIVVVMNRLGNSESSYLRRAADEPVDWYAWGDEAFDRARNEDKPVLLSIGAVWCHWCHVMARETWQDPGDGGAHQPRLRGDQGGPGRPAGDRPPLPGGRAGADRAGRLAAHGRFSRPTGSLSTAAPISRARRCAACPPSGKCWKR